MGQLLDNKEAAEFLGIRTDKLSELVGHKLIPAYMIAGKLLRFKKHELEAIKAILDEKADLKDMRAFNQAFSEVSGLERFKEIMRANDIYLVLALVIVLVSILIFLR